MPETRPQRRPRRGPAPQLASQARNAGIGKRAVELSRGERSPGVVKPGRAVLRLSARPDVCAAGPLSCGLVSGIAEPRERAGYTSSAVPES